MTPSLELAWWLPAGRGVSRLALKVERFQDAFRPAGSIRQLGGAVLASTKVFIVYLMASRKNGTLYAGVSSDPAGRIWQHKNDWYEGFAKRYGVKTLVWYEYHPNAEAAIRREKQIKEWQRAWKIRLIEARNPEWRDLYPELTEGIWL